jgi:hypothetical protein
LYDPQGSPHPTQNTFKLATSPFYTGGCTSTTLDKTHGKLDLKIAELVVCVLVKLTAFL